MSPARKRRRSYRITVILAIAMGGLVLASTGTVLLLSERAALNNTIELLRAAGLLAVDRVADATERHMRPARVATEEVASLIAEGKIDVADRAQMKGLLQGILSAAPQISAVILWDENLNSIRVTRLAGERLPIESARHEDDTTMIRLTNALKMSGRSEWGPPIHRERSTFANIGRALYHDGHYLGAIGVGVTVDELSSFVRDIAASLSMTGFILYGNDAVLAHPELERGITEPVMSPNAPLLPINRLKDEVVRQYTKTPPRNDVKKEGYAVRSISSGGRGYLVLSRTVSSFGSVPWEIGIYAPTESLIGQMKRLLGSILAGVGVMVLAVVAAVMLARRVARPINRIAAASEQVGQFELDAIEPLPGSWIAELDQQATAFNRMIEGLKWFETYVPRKLVSRLVAGHGSADIASREAVLTVMFTDIIGFTRTTQHMSPDAVAAMLNDHFEVLGRCIEAEDGTLDKYIGDAVMAFWGAPENQPDHAARACRAAIAIARAAEAANADSVHPPIRIKIAIHSGPVVVGNIGAPNRINYTVIGDTVNTCSRIESLCREFDDGRTAIVLVSQDAVTMAGDGFAFTPVGSRAVKGRAEEVTVFRLDTAQ